MQPHLKTVEQYQFGNVLADSSKPDKYCERIISFSQATLNVLDVIRGVKKMIFFPPSLSFFNKCLGLDLYFGFLALLISIHSSFHFL